MYFHFGAFAEGGVELFILPCFGGFFFLPSERVILVKYGTFKIHIFPYKALLVYLKCLQNFALLNLVASF